MSARLRLCRAASTAMVPLAVLAASACGGDDAGNRAPLGDAEGRGGMPRELAVVQVAAFSDSAPAARMRDSLAAAGWQALLRHQPGDTMPAWRVRVAPTPHLDMARLTVAGFQAAGHPAVMLRDVATLEAPAVQGIRVNRGAAGVRTRVRWAHSPERDALLVVEDARGAGDLPLPDGFLLATEHPSAGAHPVLQRDSVWDVAPSPDWRRIAYGRAYLIRSEGRDSITWRHWSVIARRANLEVTTVNEGGFLVDQSNNLHSFVQPVIEPIGESPAAATGVTRRIADAVPSAGGWRVGWSADGTTLGVGMPPRSNARDDSPPSSWRAVEVERRLLTGVMRDAGSLRRPSWTEGPELEARTRPAIAVAALHFQGGRVEGRDGWVVVYDGADDGRGRIIGPGVPLAVTRGGRFIAVIAPVPDARPNEPPLRALVYRLE